MRERCFFFFVFLALIFGTCVLLYAIASAIASVVETLL